MNANVQLGKMSHGAICDSFFPIFLWSYPRMFVSLRRDNGSLDGVIPGVTSIITPLIQTITKDYTIMRKTICTLLVLFASLAQAFADDAITAQNVTVPKGGEAWLEIDMTNSKAYGGFEFELKLPAGITVPKDATEETGISSTAYRKATRITNVESTNKTFDLMVSVADETNNIYKVLCFNTKAMSIEGTSIFI